MTGLLDAKAAGARAVALALRRSGRGGGTTLPGRVMLKLDRRAISRLAARLPLGSAVISATNGKTTTAAMTAQILAGTGATLVHNRAGANMAGGIAGTLVDATRRGAQGPSRMGLFEVDEFWLPQLAPELSPRAILLGNLFRDQLDRYGELDTIADRWAATVTALPPETELVLNADDPLIADLGRDRANVTYFGVEDHSVAIPEMQHASDSKHCRNCGAPYAYEAIFLGHMGIYSCPSCGRTRPRPAVSAGEIRFRGTAGVDFTLRTPAGDGPVTLPLPGLYNVYNALGAAALGLALGATLAQVIDGLQRAVPAFGRAETVQIGEVSTQLLLIKNPAGANEVLRTLTLAAPDRAAETATLNLLAILNDRIADGRDISWIWDADWELIAPHVESAVCSGTRAAELALRLKYAGVPVERLTVVPDLSAALDAALSGAAHGLLYVLPTYTALLALREELTRRGHVSAYWEEAG